jgi:hypothetical protein
MPNTPPPPKIREQFVSDSIPVGFPWRLFIFSLTLFVFSLFIYFGLKFGYTAYIDQRAENLDQKISALATQVSEVDQQSFIAFYSQLVNLERVLDRHKFTANVFNFLEQNTLGEVYYNHAEFSSTDNSFNLRGFAATSETLVNQLSLFDNRSEVSRVNLNQMNTTQTGDVAFGITVFFRNDFFQNPTQ